MSDLSDLTDLEDDNDNETHSPVPESSVQVRPDLMFMSLAVCGRYSLSVQLYKVATPAEAPRPQTDGLGATPANPASMQYASSSPAPGANAGNPDAGDFRKGESALLDTARVAVASASVSNDVTLPGSAVPERVQGLDFINDGASPTRDAYERADNVLVSLMS